MTDNPFEPPMSRSKGDEPRKGFNWRLAGAVLILIAMLPAAGIACFTICLAVAAKDANQLLAGLVFGGIGAAVVLGLLSWWAIVLMRKKG